MEGFGRKKPRGKGLLGGPKSRWEDNIKMKLKNGIGSHGLDYSGSG
jgi:hypothetical protein